MLELLARAAAVLFWMPGIGIPISSTQMLSPYEILLLVIMPALWITALDARRRVFAGLAFGIATMSFVASTDRSFSTMYYAFWLAITVPNMLLLLNIFEDSKATSAFVSAFIKTGVWLVPLALIQFFSPIAIVLSNNTNYAIMAGAHRGILFTPEGSTLAALYICALAMVLLAKWRNAESRIPASTPIISTLFAGLVTTISSSILTLFPMIVLYILVICRTPLKRLLAIVGVGIVGGALFYSLVYEIRISSGSTSGSVSMRLATTVMGAILAAKYWKTGLGPGLNKGATDDVAAFFYQFTGILGDTKTGFDNFVLAQMVEMGVLPGILSLAALFFMMRYLWRRRDTQLEAFDCVVIYGISIWIVAFAVGGYRGLSFQWIYYPAGYMAYRRLRKPVATSPAAVAVPAI